MDYHLCRRKASNNCRKMANGNSFELKASVPFDQRQVRKGGTLWRTSNQSRQKDQQEFTSTCGNFLFDQEKPCRKREGKMDDKS